MTDPSPTRSTRHSLVHTDDPYLILDFLVHGDKVSIRLESSRPNARQDWYITELEGEPWPLRGPWRFAIFTGSPIENLDIGYARVVWESLVVQRGWREMPLVTTIP